MGNGVVHFFMWIYSDSIQVNMGKSCFFSLAQIVDNYSYNRFIKYNLVDTRHIARIFNYT